MRKFAALAALFTLASCKGSDTEPLVTTTVTVTVTPSSIGINETAQATATPKDQNGNPIAGKTASWTSLNPNIASVNATGQVRGLAAGTATIQGSVDGVTSTAAVAVVAPSAICVSGPTTVDTEVGGVRVLSASASNGCAKISAVTAGRGDYLVIPASLTTAQDAVTNFVLKSDEGETVPSTSVQTRSSILADVLSPRGDLGSAQIAYETSLRQFARSQLRLSDARGAYVNQRLNRGIRYSISSAVPAIGDTLTFKVPKVPGPCTNFVSIKATVQYVSNRAIIYRDNADPAGGFTAADYQQIGDEFDNLIYAVDTSYFGTPIDMDNNGRIIILYTVEVNKLTPAGSSGFVGGFFFPGDLFPATGPGSCAQSNEAELFYVLSPDTAGTINGNKRSTTSVRQGTRGTIAHEFTHMINFSERIRSPVEQSQEEIWLDEALAHFAEDAVGRFVRGIGEFDNANFNTVFGGSNADYNAFFFQNFARFEEWLKRPNALAPISALADTSLGARGAAWALLHYTADNYAPGGNVKAWTKKLTAGLDGATAVYGAVNLSRQTGNISVDSLLAGWLVANYVDDLGVPVQAKYTYRSYNMRDNEGRIATPTGTYPLAVTAINANPFSSGSQSLRSGTGAYFTISRAAGAPARTFRFLSSDGTTTATVPGGALIFVRTQ